MVMQAFTRNYHDNSGESGFSFEFFCDICGDGYKSRFVECINFKKTNFFSGLAEGLSAGARMVGLHNVAYGLDQGGHLMSNQFSNMSAEWHKEHEAAFNKSVNEAMDHFHRCHGCHIYVCDACFNEDEGMCTNCAPRESTAVSKARSQRMVDQINEKAQTADVFKGSITSRQIICPNCGKPAGTGKFCSNCGMSVALPKCPKCGAENQAGAKFCTECGAKQGASTCSKCGTETAPGAKFCNNCGNAL